MANLTALTAEVARAKTVDESAAALLAGLAAALEAAQGDPAAIQTIVDDLRSNSDALAAAVVQNTPAA